MKISVITISYNNVSVIENTILSVINQTYSNLEYIIVDGASTDGTLDILYRYSNKISKVISEPDKGIYDALNKGISSATGDVIGFIHAGDLLYDDYVIEKIAAFHEMNDVDISYGGSKNINKNNKVVRINPGLKYPYKWALNMGWMPSHMSIYAKKHIYDKYGLFRLDVGYVADYEWVVRCFVKYRDEISIKLLDDFILYFALGGVSSSNELRKLKSCYNRMIKNCWLVNGLKPILGLVYLRPIWVIRIILLYRLNIVISFFRRIF